MNPERNYAFDCSVNPSISITLSDMWAFIGLVILKVDNDLSRKIQNATIHGAVYAGETFLASLPIAQEVSPSIGLLLLWISMTIKSL